MLDGTYKISLNTPMGDVSGTLRLYTNGNNVQGVLEVMGMKSNFNGLKISNDKCKFSDTLKTPFGNFNYTATCTVLGTGIELDVNTSQGNLKLNGKKIN